MSALVFETFSPTLLNVQAMRLTMLNDMRKVGTKIKKDYESTVSSWSEKPVFEMIISLAGGPQVEVFTLNEIYGYVDKGTKPHLIWAGFYTGKSEHKVLAFASKSTPKTTPGVIGSSAGSIGSVDKHTPYVKHPGGKPRDFSKEIQKKWQPKFRMEMEATMIRVAQASGHAL